MRTSLLLSTFFIAFISGCASTTIKIIPSPQPAVCDRTASALVLWSPEWRSDQKDIAERELAAEAGIKDFLARSGCFSHSKLQRVPDLKPASLSSQISSASKEFKQVLAIGVRELGPVVKLLSSALIVEGGTEVVLHIQSLSTQVNTSSYDFTIHWQNGGPGVIKGVTSLPSDMYAALKAALQPSGVSSSVPNK